MLPDFNRLKVFYHIYRTGSVVAAADELCLTQSGVSISKIISGFLDGFHRHMQQQEWTRRVRYLGL